MNGICTLANDRVYDQLIALLNSIEAQMGAIPVCIYPYDDNTDRIAAALTNRPQVMLYDDRASMQRWDQFVRSAWDAHPTARQRWQIEPNVYYRMGTHRRFCAFDGPFDRFLYMDADTLLLKSIGSIFDLLEVHDWITYDFQFNDLSHVFDDRSPRLRQVFSEAQLRSQIFCSGFYAARKDLFTVKQRDWLLAELQAGDAEALYPMAPDQSVLNYMVIKSGRQNYNLARELPPDQRTGCCVTSPHFVERDRLLFDRQTQLTYLHYIGLSSSLFSRVCAGENIEFPYREIFLHYRYLHEPENRPRLSGQPRAYDAPLTLPTRLLRKLGLVRS